MFLNKGKYIQNQSGQNFGSPFLYHFYNQKDIENYIK